MSVFRPSNINRRLVGTPATSTTVLAQKGSPGNGGQIGPKKVPYFGGALFCLGSRFQFGSCGGVFKANESRCGRKEDCQCTLIDCKGFFIACSGANKFFVAPACTEVVRTWYCSGDAVIVANSCMGSCGWFVPTKAQLQNPGFTGRSNWDSFCSSLYWSASEIRPSSGYGVCMDTGICFPTPGTGPDGGTGDFKNGGYPVRAFRCTAT